MAYDSVPIGQANSRQPPLFAQDRPILILNLSHSGEPLIAEKMETVTNANSGLLKSLLVSIASILIFGISISRVTLKFM